MHVSHNYKMPAGGGFTVAFRQDTTGKVAPGFSNDLAQLKTALVQGELPYSLSSAAQSMVDTVAQLRQITGNINPLLGSCSKLKLVICMTGATWDFPGTVTACRSLRLGLQLLQNHDARRADKTTAAQSLFTGSVTLFQKVENSLKLLSPYAQFTIGTYLADIQQELLGHILPDFLGVSQSELLSAASLQVRIGAVACAQGVDQDLIEAAWPGLSKEEASTPPLALLGAQNYYDAVTVMLNSHETPQTPLLAILRQATTVT